MAVIPARMVAGNWKMNMLHNEGMAIVNSLAEEMDPMGEIPVDVAVCPPMTLVGEVAAFVAVTRIVVGAQDCSPLENGAHTGDISAAMLADIGCACCIVGHSERRTHHGEDDDLVRAKALAVQKNRMTAIICIGETEEQRKAGQTIDVVTRQLEASVPEGATSGNTVIAYEPVWAIGTGRTPTLEEIGEVHGHIRDELFDRLDYDGYGVRILYGGSVNAENAHDIFRVKSVNGALVGGASMDADVFWKIIRETPAPAPPRETPVPPPETPAAAT